MESSRHVLLAGDGAERFAREVGAERVRRSYFHTQERYEEWLEEVRRERRSPAGGLDTVGAVARDRYGNLAAATSTGGLTNKRFGRVGDGPIIGAGTYANNATAAISCTGKGEEFIRHAVAHEISAQMEHGGKTLTEAAEDVILRRLAPGDGGMIGVAADGTIAMVFNSPGMYRGAADSSGRFEVAVWADEGSTPPAAEEEQPAPVPDL
jgi:beta-aspartyl-peptidase (threonine type)